MQVVNFSAAKATLNFRLSKLVKKAEVGAKRDGIACGETPKVLRHYLTFSPANSLHVFFQARGSGEADQ